MQIFPADTIMSEGSGNTLPQTTNGSSGERFGNVLSSFIEEDRYDYCGRPAGFAAYGPESGTIDRDTATRIARELRKRNVSELSVGQLETLAASGSPMTIGTVCNALSGKARLTDRLGDSERENFKLVLDKLGFSRLEKEEMLGLSDDGNTKAMEALLSGKLRNMDAMADLDRKEWNALLRGLDVSTVNRRNLLALFGKGESGGLEVRELSGADLEKMLATVRGEYGEREQAAAFARSQARGAITASIEAAGMEKHNAPVENARGSRRLEQKETLMQNSVRRNTGVDRLKNDDQELDADFHNEEQDGGRGFEEGEGRKRFERMTAAPADAAARKNAESEKPKAPQVETLLHTISVAPGATRPEPGGAAQAQNLNTSVNAFRREIFAQVEQGILNGTQNGSNSLTLQLNPAELGQVTIILSVQQGEVKATIRADREESAGMLREQMAELKAALESEGLKVKELDVQTGLREDSLADQWDGHQEHNLMRDAEERGRMMRLARIRRETAGQTGRAEVLEGAAPMHEKNGLHVVA